MPITRTLTHLDVYDFSRYCDLGFPYDPLRVVSYSFDFSHNKNDSEKVLSTFSFHNSQTLDRDPYIQSLLDMSSSRNGHTNYSCVMTTQIIHIKTLQLVLTLNSVLTRLD